MSERHWPVWVEAELKMYSPQVAVTALKVGPGTILGKHVSGHLPRLHATDSQPLLRPAYNHEANPATELCTHSPKLLGHLECVLQAPCPACLRQHEDRQTLVLRMGKVLIGSVVL